MVEEDQPEVGRNANIRFGEPTGYSKHIVAGLGHLKGHRSGHARLRMENVR